MALCRRGAADLDDVARSEAALRGTLARREIEGIVLPSAVDGSWRVKRAPRHAGKVSIVIPTCAAHGYIETCLTTLRDRTSYADYEVVVIDNIPDTQMAWKVWLQKNADKVVDMPDAFNWSRFNNLAADVADGEYLLFLNDDIEFEQDDWLDVLLEHAQRADVGVVGARLLYPDRKVQHAGMFLSNNGIGRHAFRFAAEDEPGYFGLALTQRNVMAVTGACMLVRREVFHALGRFDEAHQIVNNDLDFCLRAHKAGLLTVFTPYATLIHHELASRDRLKDVFDLSHFNAHWKTLFAAGDPYFSPMLSRHADDYRPDDEAVEAVHAANPLFRADDIKRILVVKLDHIGDFVTALPAIRRLKSLFPHAHLTVLAGPAFNIALTLIVFFGLTLYGGVPENSARIGSVQTLPTGPVPLQMGDTILALNGVATPDFATLAKVSKDLRDAPVVTYRVDRAGQTLSFDGPNPVPPLVKTVSMGSAAEAAGLKPGDLFLKVGDKTIAGFDQMPTLVEASGGKPVDLTILRGTDTLHITLTPRRADVPNADGGFDTRWLIGVTGSTLFDAMRRTPGLGEAARISAEQSWYMAKTNLNGIVQIIKGTISSCNLSGPIGMAKVAAAAVQSGVEAFIGTLALMSLTIGLANLLPIPVLDGGHLVFHVYEAIFRRPPNERVMQVLMTAGLAILLSLMVFAFSNDLFLCA